MKKYIVTLITLIVIGMALCAKTKTRVRIGKRYLNSLTEFGYVISDSMKFHLVGKDSLVAEGAWTQAQEVIIPPSLDADGKKYNVTGLKTSAFEANTIIESIILPSSVTEIASSAFRRCPRLQHCEMPNVRKIRSYAFFRTGFERIVFPEGLEVIGYCAFTECHELKYIELPSTIKRIEEMAFVGTKLDTIKVHSPIPIEITYEPFWISVSPNKPRRNIVLSVPAGSAETYSKAEGWKYFSNIVEH